MPTLTPYHAGELEVQRRAQQHQLAQRHSQLIMDSIMPGAWSFLAEQQMLLAASWDGERGVWPSVIFGQPGFISTIDGTQLRVDMTQAIVDETDPVWQNLRGNGQLGLLAIELATRRRLRINGHLQPLGELATQQTLLNMHVEQSYANCPKYIQRRVLSVEAASARPAGARFMSELDASQQDMIKAADTAFVASRHSSGGADISHRGGNPGFVQVESSRRLRIPDYAGNSMFNTLGNIQASGYAGLMFIDFAGEQLLQIIGDAHIDWAPGADGAERTWLMDIRQIRASRLPAGLAWQWLDASRFNPPLTE